MRYFIFYSYINFIFFFIFIPLFIDLIEKKKWDYVLETLPLEEKTHIPLRKYIDVASLLAISFQSIL